VGCGGFYAGARLRGLHGKQVLEALPHVPVINLSNFFTDVSPSQS
jgi:hypothetical protein